MEKMVRKKRPYLFFIAPGFLLYTVFVILPILFVIYLSVFKWSGLGTMEFIGFENFATLFTDSRIAPVFFNALRNNLKYLLCVWCIITPIQFLIAYLFYIKIPLHRYFKFMIVMPYVISTSIVSFFAIIIFNPTVGFLNTFLKRIGLESLTGAWIGDSNLVFKIMIALIIWQGSAYGILLFYANMVGISKDIIDASRIDGCTNMQRLVKIIIPLSLPSCASVIIMSSIWALGLFDIPFMLGGPTGGVNGKLDFVNMVFYRYTFGSALSGEINLGFGAAISVAMCIFILFVTKIQNRVLDKFDYE